MPSFVPENTMLGHFTLCRACIREQARRCLNWRNLRSLSTSRHSMNLVEVSTESLGKFTIAKVSINRPPVNSFNIPLVTELTKALINLEDYSKADAVIIKSSIPSVFSAGLDLNDLYGVSEEHLRKFWKHIQEMWLQLYASKLTTVAAINGHCLAAGTILSSSCDYRIAVEGSYNIGVTAAKIGVIAPPWFLKMLTYLMGQRKTEMFLQQGLVFPPEEAQAIGLVDEVCSLEQLTQNCTKALQPFLDVSHEARAKMKLSLRGELIEMFRQSRDRDLENFVSFILSESVQSKLGEYIELLKRK